MKNISSWITIILSPSFPPFELLRTAGSGMGCCDVNIGCILKKNRGTHICQIKPYSWFCLPSPGALAFSVPCFSDIYTWMCPPLCYCLALCCLLGREKGRERQGADVADLPAPILSSLLFSWAPKPKFSQGYVQRHLLSVLMRDARVAAGKGKSGRKEESRVKCYWLRST